jgi:hypothetical protein
LSGQNNHIWAYNISDPAALEMASTSERIASCWYLPSSFEISVATPDLHTVSLYLLDWDNSARSERVEVLDATTGALLDTQTVSGFQNGAWLKWKVRGVVRVRITRITGPNAVASGIFLD